MSAIAASQINASSKIILTGTPIENNWEELWSLFNIINPNYLESDYSKFKEIYLDEDESGNLRETPQLLNKTKYFILSRKKEDVLKELPEKIHIEKSEIRCWVNKYIEKNNLPIVIRLGKRNKSLRFNQIFLSLMSSNKMIITYINHLLIRVISNDFI